MKVSGWCNIRVKVGRTRFGAIFFTTRCPEFLKRDRHLTNPAKQLFYVDIRSRKAGSGLWVVITLLAGFFGALIYAVVRLGDMQARE